MANVHFILNLDKKSRNAESTHAKMMFTLAEARPKVPSAADALRRTRNILAAVTSGRQANNNNNPEDVSHGKGSNQDTAAARPEHGNCVKGIGGTRASDHAAEQHMVSDSAHADGASENGLKETPLKEQNEASTHFPAPILVRAAGVQTDTINSRLGETEHCNDTVNVIETTWRADNPNNSESANNVYEICDQMSQKDELSTQTSTVRESGLPGRISCNERVLSGSLTTQTVGQRSRLAGQSRPNGQLYRFPATSCAVQPRNRTQQSVSLGCAQTVPRNLPPPVNLSHGAPTSKPAAHGQLKLDFNFVNMAQNTQRSTQKHVITLDHLKKALEIARRNLQNMWTAKENSLAKEASPHMRSTVSTFTVTEVDSMNIPADYAEKDSVSSETLEPIASEMIYEGAGAVDTNTRGDASTADSITEVENIFYVQHRSQNDLTNVLEVCAGRVGLSCNDGEEGKDDKCREISSCQRQKDVVMCSRCSSDTFAKREDRSELRSPIPIKYIDNATATASCPQTQRLNHCHAEATRLNTEQGTTVRATHVNGDTRTQGEFKQTEAFARETTVPYTVDNTDEIPARHSQSNAAHRKEKMAPPSSHDINVNVRLTRTKSAENSACAEQHKGRTKSCRPYSTGERKALEGDNKCDCILAVKIREDFPPHFPGAGDAVENVHIVDNVKGSPYGSFQLAVIRDEKQEPNASKWNRAEQNEPEAKQAAEGGRKEATKPPRKRNSQKAGNRLLFIQPGRSNNASQERENTICKTTSENDVLLDPTLVQPKKYEEHSILTEDSVENVSGSQAEQDSQMRVSCLGESSCNSSLKDSVKQNYFEDGDIRIHRRSYTCERSHPNDSSSISDQSNSVVSLIVFNQSTEDASLNTTEKPADVIAVATQTTRSASDSFVRSHRRTRGRTPKVQHARDSMGKEDSKLTQEVTSDNAIASGSNYTHYFDMIPGFMPSNNCHSCPKIQNSSSKNILIMPSLRDQPLATVECNSKAIFSDKTDSELEMAEKQANFQISSAMAEKGSLDSSKNSSIQVPNVAQDAALAQAHPPSSSEVNTPLASPPLHEEPTNAPGGLKFRLRRFFSQCLHPLSRRN